MVSKKKLMRSAGLLRELCSACFFSHLPCAGRYRSLATKLTWPSAVIRRQAFEVASVVCAAGIEMWQKLRWPFCFVHEGARGFRICSLIFTFCRHCAWNSAITFIWKLIFYGVVVIQTYYSVSLMLVLLVVNPAHDRLIKLDCLRHNKVQKRRERIAVAILDCLLTSYVTFAFSSRHQVDYNKLSPRVQAVGKWKEDNDAKF